MSDDHEPTPLHPRPGVTDLTVARGIARTRAFFEEASAPRLWDIVKANQRALAAHGYLVRLTHWRRSQTGTSVPEIEITGPDGTPLPDELGGLLCALILFARSDECPEDLGA